MFQTHKHNKHFKALRIFLLLPVSAFIFYKLFVAYDIDRLFLEFKRDGAFGSTRFILAAAFLGILNWALEAFKWQKIISKYETLSYKIAVKAVFSGATLNIITPNQIGDFAGRVIHLQVLNKIKGSLATVIGHTAQVLVTCMFGAYALYVFGDTFFKQQWMVILGIALIITSVLLYLKLAWIYPYVMRIKWLQKFKNYLAVFGDFSSIELWHILNISLMRYIVFTSQYILLLHFYKVDVSLADAIACLAGTFFVQSVVPSFLLLEIGLRGASALWFFSMFSSHSIGILLSAYSLWMMNMLLPALAGLYFIYKAK